MPGGITVKRCIVPALARYIMAVFRSESMIGLPSRMALEISSREAI